MKVTAIIPDEIVNDVRKYTGGKNITESLIKALSDWLYAKRINELNSRVAREPISFVDNYSTSKVRKLNNRK
jgi:hypothetical protein